MSVLIAVEEAGSLGRRVLLRHGVGEKNAAVTVKALLRAELEGIPSHGFSRLPFYAAQAASGKLDGAAEPLVERPRPGLVKVDARCGFAFRAFAEGLPEAARAAVEQGAALLCVANSHHAGVLGFPVADLAAQGLLALGFSNSPAALAPYGGSRMTFGTNPLALGCPRREGEPLVIDLSMGLLARGKILQAAERGEEIPEGAAVDAEGRPTRDPRRALEGAMLPFGGAKGSALALIVEILAAGLTASSFGFEASSFFSAEGEAPRIGQSFLVIDPQAAAGAGFTDRLEVLLGFIQEQPGARLPGARRAARREKTLAEGRIALPEGLYRNLLELIGK